MGVPERPEGWWVSQRGQRDGGSLREAGGMVGVSERPERWWVSQRDDVSHKRPLT